LLFISLVGLKALGYANQIGTEIQRIQQEQEESDQILDELRADTYAASDRVEGLYRGIAG